MKWLVDDWKRAHRMISVWVYALIGIAPDLYSGVVAMGWLQDESVPPLFVWTLRGLAVVGIAGRLLKQNRPEPPSE